MRFRLNDSCPCLDYSSFRFACYVDCEKKKWRCHCNHNYNTLTIQALLYYVKCYCRSLEDFVQIEQEDCEEKSLTLNSMQRLKEATFLAAKPRKRHVYFASHFDFPENLRRNIPYTGAKQSKKSSMETSLVVILAVNFECLYNVDHQI